MDAGGGRVLISRGWVEESSPGSRSEDWPSLLRLRPVLGGTMSSSQGPMLALPAIYTSGAEGILRTVLAWRDMTYDCSALQPSRVSACFHETWPIERHIISRARQR